MGCNGSKDVIISDAPSSLATNGDVVSSEQAFAPAVTAPGHTIVSQVSHDRTVEIVPSPGQFRFI